MSAIPWTSHHKEKHNLAAADIFNYAKQHQKLIAQRGQGVSNKYHLDKRLLSFV